MLLENVARGLYINFCVTIYLQKFVHDVYITQPIGRRTPVHRSLLCDSKHTNPHRLFQSSVHSSPMDDFNLIEEATRLFLDPLMPLKLKYKHRLFHLCDVVAFWLHVNLLSCNFNFLTVLSYLHIFIIILSM